MKAPDPETRVDIQFRNGIIKRDVKAGNYRFGNWTGQHSHLHPHPYDIGKWQPAKEE